MSWDCEASLQLKCNYVDREQTRPLVAVRLFKAEDATAESDRTRRGHLTHTEPQR